MPVSDLVSVSISSTPAPLTAAGFGVPLIAGQHTRFVERFRVYTSLAGMLADGFLATDPEYLSASALLSQKKRPQSFVIGRRLTPVPMVMTIVVTTVANTTVYSGTINGVAWTYTSDGTATVAEIRDGIIAALNGSTQAAYITASASGNDVLVTSDIAGIPFALTGTANLTITTTTANVGIEEDLSAFEDAGAVWWATLLTSRDVNTIRRGAVWTQSRRKGFFPQTSEANSASVAYSPVGTDLLALLRQGSYSRTAPIWHSNDAQYEDAALVGRMLPATPGTESWSWKELAGITPAALTTTQFQNIVGVPGNGPGGKYGNVYYALSDAVSATYQGTVSSGEWIDTIRYIDWLQARIEVEVVNHYRGVDKVAYTDADIQALANRVRGVLSGDASAGILSPLLDDQGQIVTPAWAVEAPASANISSTNRAARVLTPGITFTARYAGAIHHVNISGAVAA
jgi:hypothetical protein